MATLATVISITASLGSVGLGIGGAMSSAAASREQARALAADRKSAFETAVLTYETLGEEITDVERRYDLFAGAADAYMAGAGIDVDSNLGAQLRAQARYEANRDIDALRRNADMRAAQLGFGEEYREEKSGTNVPSGRTLSESWLGNDPLLAAREAAFNV
jgi:hypothetical protein